MLVVVVGLPVLPPVLKASVAACEDVCTCTDHVLREGKLLAVEDEEGPVRLEIVLRPSAFLLQSADLVLLVFDEFAVLLDIDIVLMDALVVGVDLIVVVGDAGLKAIDPVVKPDDGVPEGFETNEELSFSIDS